MTRQWPYMAMADVMRQNIRDGIWPPGFRLLPQDALAKIFGVSRETVKRALDVLVREGLIERSQGHRAVVKTPPGTPQEPI